MLLVVLGALPALAVIGIMGIRLHEAALGTVEQSIADRLNLIAQGQRRIAAENRTLLFALAHIPQLAPGESGCRKLLNDIRTFYPRYAFLGVVDAKDGRLYCSSPAADRPLSLADRDYVREALTTGELSVSGYQMADISHLPVLSFAQPVSQRKGSITHLIVASISLAWVEQALRTLPLAPGTAVAVFDASGEPLLRLTRDPERIPSQEAIERALAAGPLQVQRDGEAVWAAARLDVTPRHPLTAVLSMPSGPLYADAERVTQGALTVLAASLLLLLIIAWYGSAAAVLKPLRQLLAATQRLAQGEWTFRSGLGGMGGEVGQLASAFDRMAANLEANAGAIAQRNREIARLNRVYAVLSGINSAILRTRSAREVSQEACRIAVQAGGFGMAWIGLFRDARLATAAYSGGDEMALRALRLEPRLRHGPVAAALRAHGPIAVNDIATDRRTRHWRRSAQARGYRACAALPLTRDGNPMGALLLFATERGFFDTAEMQLLEELCADLSFALVAIERERQVDYLAHHDALTGLPNRTLFDDRLKLALLAARRQRETLAILLFEVDDFNRITSTLGRHIGDALLVELAGRLTRLLPGGWTLARLGSADFGLLIPAEASPQEATHATSVLFQSFPGTLRVLDEELYVTASVGIALFPDDGREAQELMRNADSALRLAAREAGENSHRFFTPEMNARAHADLNMERALRHALEREEFSLLFQPIIAADASTRIVGAEALLRWHNPALGAVPPGHFVHMLESSGLIIPVGEWVCRQSWAQAVGWRRAGLPPLRVAVNASMRQLQAPHFVAMTERILSDIDFDPRRDRLGLELTESQLMENAAQSGRTLDALKAMGLSIYIDDFGTGYSSLSYLNSLSLDVLKIDVSFIRDLTRHSAARAIVRAILSLSRALRLEVVAEGVETEAQASQLREMGCDAFQGFLFSPPLPALALAERLH